MSEPRQRIAALLEADDTRTSLSIAREVGMSRQYVQHIRQRMGFSNAPKKPFADSRPPIAPTYPSGASQDFDVDWLGRLIYRGPRTAQENG